MRHFAMVALLATLVLVLALPGVAQDVVELRMTWYTDGNEDEVMRDLLDRFEMEHSDIRVVMDNVSYQEGILGALPVQLAAGEGPDMARVTNLGGLAEYYLDLTPYLDDPDYWVESFGVGLGWLQLPGDSNISGLPTQLTVTGPFINRTLFEQAGVAVPSDSSDQVTWEEWAAAANEVAEILDIPFPMAMDRSGHRFAGPAISMGAQYFDDEGHPLIAGDEGFRAMAELFVNWHLDGTMPLEIWAANTGYAGANEEFGNSQVVFYMSGSWQIGQFSDQIGDAFDWAAVPNPCGPGGCTGLPGGAWVVAIGDTEHPEEVARVMEYLASEEIQEEFYARTLFIPGHQGLLSKGMEFETDLGQALGALDAFFASANALEQTAYDIQGYAFNFIVFNASRDRLTQAIVGELTLDEAIERIQEDVDEQLAERMGG
ncbi:MAG: ABC transporter substrate-binding protein [Anaerolineaceae bacterium]|nr:ABC transporter substrate-binding protein [Anaerolineaceae bacterium]MDE0329641.1 ABC transporter substrate-binding protein [Anaerolineaceae bacterium]